MGLGLTIVVIAVAALAGAALCYAVLALRAARKDTEHARLAAAAERVPALEGEAVELRDRLREAETANAALEAVLETERKNHEARGAELEKKFAGLASDVLGKNSESFLRLVSERFEKHSESAREDLEKRRVAIETLVKPLGENLTKFERKVGEMEKAREGAYRAIAEQVKSLAEGQTGLRTETGRLVQALRRPEARGRWGEYQLRNVLEMAGMSAHVDFVEQQTVEGDNGKLRPDVIIRIPGGKSIVVDAKTPLDAYLNAVEADDEDERRKFIDAHARQVREHVRALASREYWRALPETPEFVVMFVPGEAFFAAAIESDRELFESAARRGVLISTPTSLIALVKTIAYGWQQEKLAENAKAVAAQGRDLYERVKTFGGHMGDIGKSLQQAVERYNKGVGSLERRVLPAARKFETLGVTPAASSIPALEPVELDPREPQAEELAEAPAEEAAE